MAYIVSNCSYPGCNGVIVIPKNMPPTNVGHSSITISLIRDSDELSTRKPKLSELEIKKITQEINKKLKAEEDDTKQSEANRVVFCPYAHPNIINS